MSTTTWSPVQHRSQLVQQLLHSGSARLTEVDDPELRTELAAEFPTLADLLAELHGRWSSLLEANLEVALDEEDPAYAMGIAWDATVLHSPGLRRILDAHEQHPMLRALTHRERVRLGRLTGLGAGGVVHAVERFTAAG